MQTLVKGSVFSLLGTNPLRTTGGPTDRCGVKHGSPHQGPALTQARSVEGPPPTPTWCSKTPALHLGSWSFCSQDPKTPRVPWHSFMAPSVTQPTAQAGPVGWYTVLPSVQGCGKVPERFSRKGCSINHPRRPGQMVYLSPLLPALPLCCLHS